MCTKRKFHSWESIGGKINYLSFKPNRVNTEFTANAIIMVCFNAHTSSPAFRLPSPQLRFFQQIHINNKFQHEHLPLTDSLLPTWNSAHFVTWITMVTSALVLGWFVWTRGDQHGLCNPNSGLWENFGLGRRWLGCFHCLITTFQSPPSLLERLYKENDSVIWLSIFENNGPPFRVDMPSRSCSSQSGST